MTNSITQGKERELPPDDQGEILRGPTPAVVELRTEIQQATSFKEAGQGEAMRQRSSIESRGDLRIAAANENQATEPAKPASITGIDPQTAQQWADLDAGEFGRIRSNTRREAALETIAGHVSASPEYAAALHARSPVLAESARLLNEERLKVARGLALPMIQQNAAALLPGVEGVSLPAVEQHELARQDIKSLAVLPEGSPERHLAAAVVGENARQHTAYRIELERSSPQLARDASDAAGEREALRSIERRNEELVPVTRDGLAVAEARNTVTKDLAAIALIEDQETRYQAAVTMGDNARTQVNYRAELELQSPAVADEVKAATAESERRIVAKDERKSEEAAAMRRAMVEQASSWTAAQAIEQVRKDVAGLRDADPAERSYMASDMAVSMEHSKTYSDALAKEAPEVAREVAVQRERDAAEREASERHREIVAADAKARAALIDAAALAAVANIRTRETARVVEQLAASPSSATEQLREAQESLKAPPLDGRVTAPNDPDIAAQQRGRALKRPVGEEDLSQALKTRYIVSHEKRGWLDKGATEFTFRSGEEQGRVAFRDVGKTLSTEREDKATLRAMLEVVATKGWKEVTFSGTEDFRRTGWLEASLMGIQGYGYEPREADRKLLAELQQQNKPVNQITAVDREPKRDEPARSPGTPSRAVAAKHVDGDALTVDERTVLDNSRAILDSKALGDKFTKAALDELEAKLRGERVYVGEVVEHGRAPYKFDKENDDSYYVTLRTRSGDQVIWGKGLVEAMEGRNVGEQIVLQNIGKRDVTVQERMRDAAGKVVGTRPKESQLNAWKSELLSRFSERARKDFDTRSAARRPSLGVYDAKAPREPVKAPSPSPAQEQRRTAEPKRDSRER
ncbi:hypothetical protein L0936_19470 [Paracidovorax citrulli]|uniref:LPD7 domain-containing protein n=1 Tax=Paracidovorax citrulli TaxID=80869 RepID=UPI0002EE5B11|nr:LPD7 domain-containing protein [Paracidovorax citrulli]QCX13155.1 hypothetical protein APS58_p00011 [Paracidovorax citrulli]UMT93539.1 hypothetical protein FRC97_00090 [Paracidovorax citrulli]